MESKKTSILIFYTVQILLCFVLQSSINILPKLHGQLPLLLVSFAVTVSVFENVGISIILGLICGVLLDISSSSIIGPNAIIMTLICCAVSVLFNDLIKKRFFTVMLISALAVFLIITAQFFLNYVFYGFGNYLYFYTEKYLPRMAYTTLCIPFFYLINFRMM